MAKSSGDGLRYIHVVRMDQLRAGTIPRVQALLVGLLDSTSSERNLLDLPYLRGRASGYEHQFRRCNSLCYASDVCPRADGLED